MNTSSDNKHALRRALRARRRQLSAAQQRSAAKSVCRKLRASLVFQRARHIAIYWPAMGEVDLRALLDEDRKRSRSHRQYYLPLVSDTRRPWETTRLLFQRVAPRPALKRTGLGIQEPAFNPRQCIAATRLDLVLMPLVGFDNHGNRLGMGKGYFDRTFSPRRCRWRTPRRLGVAHGFQEVETLSAQAWDIPLHGIVTDERFSWF